MYLRSCYFTSCQVHVWQNHAELLHAQVMYLRSCYFTSCQAHVWQNHAVLLHTTLLEPRAWVGACSSCSCTEGFRWVSKPIPVFSKTSGSHGRTKQGDYHGIRCEDHNFHWYLHLMATLERLWTWSQDCNLKNQQPFQCFSLLGSSKKNDIFCFVKWTFSVRVLPVQYIAFSDWNPQNSSWPFEIWNGNLSGHATNHQYLRVVACCMVDRLTQFPFFTRSPQLHVLVAWIDKTWSISSPLQVTGCEL